MCEITIYKTFRASKQVESGKKKVMNKCNTWAAIAFITQQICVEIKLAVGRK